MPAFLARLRADASGRLASPHLGATALVLALSLVALAAPPAVAEEPPRTVPIVDRQYIVRFGDALNMRVVENDKLEIKEQPIRPDGRISLPLVGEVQAGGLTVPQLQDRVTKLYSRYFVEPHVVLNVAKFRTLTVSVIGLVNKPDTFMVNEPVHLLQALGLAGGIERERGDLHRVLVVRANGTHQLIDLQEVMDGRTEDNVILYDGDTVRVFELDGPDWYRLLPTVATSVSILTSLVFVVIALRK